MFRAYRNILKKGEKEPNTGPYNKSLYTWSEVGSQKASTTITDLTSSRKASLSDSNFTASDKPATKKKDTLKKPNMEPEIDCKWVENYFKNLEATGQLASLFKP